METIRQKRAHLKRYADGSIGLYFGDYEYNQGKSTLTYKGKIIKENIIFYSIDKFEGFCRRWHAEERPAEEKETAKGGRPKADGNRHMYTVADDVHEWIMRHGGGQYLTDTIRIIMAMSKK